MVGIPTSLPRAFADWGGGEGAPFRCGSLGVLGSYRWGVVEVRAPVRESILSLPSLSSVADADVDIQHGIASKGVRGVARCGSPDQVDVMCGE